jgi:hypothetical protein
LIDSETAIKKGFSDLVGRIYIIAKILFSGKANTEPRFGKPRGAPKRAERNGFPSENALGGALRRRRKFGKNPRKLCYCAIIRRS